MLLIEHVTGLRVVASHQHSAGLPKLGHAIMACMHMSIQNDFKSMLNCFPKVDKNSTVARQDLRTTMLARLKSVSLRSTILQSSTSSTH